MMGPSLRKAAVWTGYGSFGAAGEATLRPNGPFTPFAAVGLATFNADGTSTNTDTIQLAGGVFNRSFSNTFQIGADCRGTITVEGATEPTAHIVVAPDGKEILFINSISGVVISGFALFLIVAWFIHLADQSD